MADKKSGVADKKTERDERLAKALRENLKRRKVAARESGSQGPLHPPLPSAKAGPPSRAGED